MAHKQAQSRQVCGRHSLLQVCAFGDYSPRPRGSQGKSRSALLREQWHTGGLRPGHSWTQASWSYSAHTGQPLGPRLVQLHQRVHARGEFAEVQVQGGQLCDGIPLASPRIRMR